ncbi:HEAT repeat family [Cryptosporidium sp. chipmunk genotype I]|uniref:HEAT repeat family n=1 Tax=Cryptosporidium sp. chipmunk genotype I TaxID=1280935 RepID=UPI00351A527C|nr:HEAT repeat family [Cryptosporidium sp. chipmunk genotype I]
MSTELQKQINFQLRNNELAFLSQRALKVNRNKKERISFLFDTSRTEFHAKKGVKAENKIPIYEDLRRLRYLGEQGLLELESLNPRISHEAFNEFFENTDISSIQMLTEQEADEMLRKLKRLIDFLVPYFLLDSAKICIEYLIQAYDINVLLGEYLFYSFLPYHDMSEFCQLIRTLDIPENSEIKGLVDSIKTTRTAITSRSHLSSILIRNPTLFKNIVIFWEKRLEIFHLTKNIALTNLITWLIIEIIEDLSRSKDLKNLHVFLENIIEIIVFGTCLKGSQYEELRSTGYCILYKLSTPLLALSNETQIRMINELFRSISRNHSNSPNYLSETILLMNHILTQFGTLSNFEYLDPEISQFILENYATFSHTFKQLSDWESDFLQILTLITKSIINFGIIQDQRFSKPCVKFIESILNCLGDLSSHLLMDEKQSKMIKVITLTLIDLYSQNQIQNPFFKDIIQILHLNYPSELLSALSFSLNVSSSPDSQLFQLKEKAQTFVDIVLREEAERSSGILQSKEGESSLMFLILLNSQDISVLNSCLDIISNLIKKSSNNPSEMTHFEKRIFDLSLRHFLSSFNDNSSYNNNFNEEFALRILSLPQTIQISQFLDLEDFQSQDQSHNDPKYQWRINLIFKSFLFYFKSKVTTVYPTLFEFFSKEVSSDFNFEGHQSGNFSIEIIIMESTFPHIFGQNFQIKLMELFKSLSLVLENDNFALKNQMNNFDSILMENSDIFISLLILISHENLSFSQDLKITSSKLLASIYKKDQINAYLKQILFKSSINYLELSLILLSLKKLNLELRSNNILPNLSFSEFGIHLNNDQQIINLLESLYYKLYYYITSAIKPKNDKKMADHLVGTFILAILRSTLQTVSSKGDNIIFCYKLLNISLVDTLDIGILSANHLGLPLFQIINACSDSNHETRNKKISDLVINLTRNLFNILSLSDLPFNLNNSNNDQSYSPFYRKNVYLEILISHSYSFLEIITSKLPISQDSKNNTFPVSNLLNFLYNILSYAIIPAFLNQRSMSIKMASFRLCKAIKDKLQSVNIEMVFGNSNLKFSAILLNHNNIGTHLNNQDNNLRSCYLNKFAPKVHQVLEVIDLLLNNQSEVIVENKNQNFLETIFRDNIISNNIPGTVIILNLVMIFEIVLNTKFVEYIGVNYGILSDYVKKNLVFGIIDSNYYDILMEICHCFLIKHENLDGNIIIALSFLKQGIDNLVKYIDYDEEMKTRNELILKFLNKIQRFEKEFKYLDFIKENILVRKVFCEILLTVLDERITRSLINEHEFVSFVIGVISQIIYYSPENIKKVSLSQYIQGESIEKLDLLIIGLLEYCINQKDSKEFNTTFKCDNDSVTVINEQIILEWIYCDLNLVTLEILKNKKEGEYKFNKDLICQTLRYLKINRNRFKINGHEKIDLDILIKIEIYLIRVLEFGVKLRNTQFKDLEEVLNYFEITEETNTRDEISKFILNPMIISSITSLFSSIQIKSKNKEFMDYSKSYFKIYKILFSIYMNLAKNTQGGIDQKNYAIKSTFYSLSLFVNHSLQDCVYFDHSSKERIKGILFRILVNEQIKEIVETNKFNQILQLLSFMEKLHNDVIYGQKKQRFNNIQGIFMIINYYLNINQNSQSEDLEQLIKHLLENNLFDTRTNVYKDLLFNVQNEMEILMNFEDLDTNNHEFETRKFILKNLILMTKTIIYFLNKTLLSAEIKSNQTQDLLELFDSLILIKTLMNKKILKKLGTVLNGNETDLEINERLKSRIDELEKDYLMNSIGLNKYLEQGKDNHYNDNEEYVIKSIQKEIDQLIQSIIENDSMKKYLIIHWNLYKDSGFKVLKNLRKRFSTLLLSNKMIYLGIILKECLDKRIKIFIDSKSSLINNHDQQEPVIFNKIHYLLDMVSNQDSRISSKYKLNQKDLGVLDERMDIGTIKGSESEENEKEDLRSKFKLWIKNWYIIDLFLKVVKVNGEEKNRDKLSKLIFLRIMNFYKSHESTQDGYGLVFKIPLIQNFLLEKISKLEKTETVSILTEIQTILEDTICTIKFLNGNSNILESINVLKDRKVKTILISMVTSSYKDLDNGENEDFKTRKILLIPYLALLNTLLGSSIGSVMMNAEIRKEILINVLLHDKMVSYYDINKLTNLLKSERMRKSKFNSKREKYKEGRSLDYHFEDLSMVNKHKNNNSNLKLKFYLEELDKKINFSSEILIEDNLESYIIRILLIYCNLTSSPTSHSYNEDFIGIYSQTLKDISSELFSRLSLEENNSTKKILSDYGINICYLKLASLVLIVSLSLNFMDSNKLITEKSFVDRFSQFYLLLINLLIINFSKLHSIKENDLKISEKNFQDSRIINNQEKLSGRKRTEEEKDDENKKYNIDNNDDRKNESLSGFISSIFGVDVLLSHACVNPNWFDLDFKDIKKLSGLKLSNSYSNLNIWRLESSISTLISVFVLKLNAKRLRELILLIKRLIHRNGESFLSKVSSMTKKSVDSNTGNNSNKQAIRDLYVEISSSESSSLVKDIYSCRIWILILLAVFESTGEYGIYCLIDDVALDVKSICDLTQMNALTCVQNITISQYRNIQSRSKRSPNHQQIANLSHLDNEFGWYWYHLGIYNLILIKMIYLNLSGQNEESKDVPNSIEDYLVNPIITNLDMFALFEPGSNRGLTGCGKQWDLILSDIWIHSIRCFRSNDLILAGIIRLLVNKIRNGNDQVRMFSAEILLKLWKDEICSISILSHLSDILPTIKELLSDHSEEMINITKSIMKKIEERTGEDISKQLC